MIDYPHTHQHLDQTARDMFAQHGLRSTRQRRVLYEVLSATTSHPTADELFQMVADREQDISLATVYNTLEAFCRAGLAQKLAANSGSARYDATVANHLHVRDEHTGRIADAPHDLSKLLLSKLPPEVLKRLEAELGFKIHRVQVELVGEYTKP